MVLSMEGGPAPKGICIKIGGGPCEAFPCFPGVKQMKFFIQMAESLHVIHVQVLDLKNVQVLPNTKKKCLRMLSDSDLGLYREWSC